jgi:sortase A
MLLRVGLIMVVCSVLLAAGVVLVMSLRTPTPTAVADSKAELASSQKAAQDENKFDLGEKLEIDDEPSEESSPQEEPKPRSQAALRAEGPAPKAANRASKEQNPTSKEQNPTSKGQNPTSKEQNPPPQRRASDLMPASNTNWPLPTTSELTQVEEPRYFDPTPDAVMYLTIEALGLYSVPVIDSFDEADLERGAIHIPDTAYPWDGTSQKNVFIAGHVVGFPETPSRLVFFELDRLNPGDRIFLEDRDGNGYEYTVREVFKVSPDDAWVADTLEGRDLLTLQTCTYPTFEDRLVVRADHV